MALSLVACGKSDKEEKTTGSAVTTTESKGSDNNNSGGENQSQTSAVENVFRAATSSATGAYATITVSADVKMDDTSAWLGLCPAGRDYLNERDADDVDVIFFYADDRGENDPYVFACDFSSVEDGTYALTVSTSDDEEVGYVAIQLKMTKSGEKLTFDFENAKLNERPSK